MMVIEDRTRVSQVNNVHGVVVHTEKNLQGPGGPSTCQDLRPFAGCTRATHDNHHPRARRCSKVHRRDPQT